MADDSKISTERDLALVVLVFLLTVVAVAGIVVVVLAGHVQIGLALGIGTPVITLAGVALGRLGPPKALADPQADPLDPGADPAA